MKHWRVLTGIAAACLLLMLAGLLPSDAQEATPPGEAPAEAPAPETAEASEASPEPAEAEELRPDERVSADNNLSFPVDI